MQRKRITVINWYSLFPINHGGRHATYGLYLALSEWFDINIITLNGKLPVLKDEVQINKYLKVYQLEKSALYLQKEELYKSAYGITGETGMPELITAIRDSKTMPEILEPVKRLSAGSAVIIAEHTYTWPLVQAVSPGKTTWYRAQNVEYDYLKSGNDKYKLPQELLDEVLDCERECCRSCDAVFTISDSDRKRLSELYGVPGEKVINISAGYDAAGSTFSLPGKRHPENGNKRQKAVFISSGSQMAVDAGNIIVNMAPDLPDIDFVIAGNVCSYIDSNDLPGNVQKAGVISDLEKKALLQTADFALNPILGGSGLNIKMLEYFAYGVPVITTQFGARGLDLVDGKHCIIAEMENLKEKVVEFYGLSPDVKDDIAKSAYTLFKEKYSWRNSAAMMAEYARKTGLNAVGGADGIGPHYVPESKNYIPDKLFYIRGAGYYGNLCYMYFKSIGMSPVAFLDEDERKHGLLIGDVEIVPAAQCFTDDYEIVLAIGNWVEVAKQLLSKGINADRLSVRLPDYAVKLTSPETIPFFIDADKVKKLCAAIPPADIRR